MSSAQKWVLALTSVAALMVALGQLVVATALNTIRGDLNASIAATFVRRGPAGSPAVLTPAPARVDVVAE